jgi:protein involved in polysaccharide export with SLBB domain
MKTRNVHFLIILGLLSGCAQTQYRTTNLPQKYAASSIVDYSQLDLTPFTRPTASPDTIRPGDRLTVTLDPGTLEAESTLTWNVSVDDSGQTTLPNIGPVRVAGLDSSSAEKAIINTSLQRDVFLTPVVDVKVAERRERSILVSGAVEKPGSIPVNDDSVSLADVIVRAGGISNKASGRITISGGNAGNSTTTINGISDRGLLQVESANSVLPISQSSVQARTVSLDQVSEPQLAEIMVPEGAVVNVEKQPPRPIKVVGVIRDQVVEVPAGQNVRLLDALTMAGGQTYSNWVSDRLTITRYIPEEEKTVRIRASIRKARANSEDNILLAPFDVVTVEENVVTFTLSTLSGLFGAGVSAAQMGAL